MKIGFLGTGGSISGGQRLNTSLVIMEQSTVLMFDCSGTPEQALAGQGLSPLQVRYLFLTHSHPDHIYALPSLLHVRRLTAGTGSPAGLSLFGIPPVLAIARALLEAVYAGRKTILPVFKPLSPPGCLELPGLEVEFFRIRHGSQPALGFRVRGRGSGPAVVFSGDAEPDRAIIDRIDDNTILIHDCCGLTAQKNHTSASELAEALGDKQPLRICLSHLPALSEPETESIRKIFDRRFRGRLIIPSDGDTLSF